MPDFSNGSEFAGHRIDGEIKRGGMGVVYRATDLRLKRTVALKVIAPELARGDDFRARFEREWSVAAAIDHPSVIPVFHAGEEDGVLYTTMLWVDGMDLGDLIAERGPLPLSLAANVVAQIGEGLDAAHEHGLIHRDVKPANILLREDGRGGYRAYLSDFGLTKRVDGRTALTMSGMFVGTVDYIAPEQLLGAQIDARTDVYSLGCVFFHALAGFAPYRADSDWATLKGHEGGEIPAPTASRPELPPQVDAVIERALAKSPEDRFPSAGDLGRAALAAAAQESVKVPEGSVATGDAAQGVTAPGVPPPGSPPPTGPGRRPPGGPGRPPPPAPVGDGPPPSRDRKPLLIAAAAVMALVLVVGALAVAGVFGGGGGKDATKPPHKSPPEKPATTALTVAQVEAAATLHEPYRRSCKAAENDESVECKVKSYDVTLAHFKNVGEMRKHFLGAVSELAHGTCEDGWDVRGTWYNGDPNSPQGLLACYENVSGEPTIAWTNDPLLVEGFMTSANPGRRRSLYESWQEDTTD